MALLVTPAPPRYGTRRHVANVTCDGCQATLVVDLPGKRLARLVEKLEPVHRCAEF